MALIQPWLRRALPVALVRLVRVARLKWAVLSFRPRVVEHQYGATRLRVSLEDPLGRGWYDHDWAELDEIRRLRGRSLVPGALVFDLGAHQGIVALMLAAEVGAHGRVIAVEAHPHNASVARRNCALNGVRTVEVVNAAVTDRVGEVVVNRSLNAAIDPGGAWGRQTVAAVSIDDLAAQYGPPDVVYVDIEGHEAVALRGATGTLETHADWVVEVHGAILRRDGGDVDAVITPFSNGRYDLFGARENGGAFEPFDLESICDAERFFLLALHRHRTTKRAWPPAGGLLAMS